MKREYPHGQPISPAKNDIFQQSQSLQDLREKARKALVSYAWIIQDSHKPTEVFRWAVKQFGISDAIDEQEWSVDQCNLIIEKCTFENAMKHGWQSIDETVDIVRSRFSYSHGLLFTAFFIFLVVTSYLKARF